MRIAEIVNTLDFGGAERLVTDLSLNLRTRGHEVHVICLRTSGPLSDVLNAGGVCVYELNKPEGFSFATLRRLIRILDEHRIELVHTHNPLVHHYGAVAGRVTRVSGVVNTIHGLMNISNFGLTKALFEAAGLMTDKVIAVCRAAHDHFKSKLNIRSGQLGLIYNGIPVEKFLRISPATRTENVVFGAVGRLVPVKDHATLLRAFALVQQEYPGSRLEILGEGPIRADLERLIVALGLSGAVRLTGANPDTASFLAGVNVFVMSSLSEALPLTILEAMAAGLPIIATRVGGIPEAVLSANCGWICDAANPKVLAEGMMTSIRSADREELGRRGRAAAIARYSLSRMTAQYESLFYELLGRTVKARAGP